MMYLVNTQVGHQELDAWRYPLPEDSVIFRISRVILDLDRPPEDRLVPIQMPPDQHRSTCSDHIRCGSGFGDVEWSGDSEQIAFVSSTRDHKTATVRIADASNGRVRTLFESGVFKFNFAFNFTLPTSERSYLSLLKYKFLKISSAISIVGGSPGLKTL